MAMRVQGRHRKCAYVPRRWRTGISTNGGKNIKTGTWHRPDRTHLQCTGNCLRCLGLCVLSLLFAV